MVKPVTLFILLCPLALTPGAVSADAALVKPLWVNTLWVKTIVADTALKPAVATPAQPQSPPSQDTPDARDILSRTLEHWRGLSSYSVMSMTIHRPDWQRTMTLQAWTLGQKASLVRVMEPKKDAGNATLLLDTDIWTFSPKINRVIKIPSAMMSQSWMGSDFSNKDISKSSDILDQYSHTLLDTEQQDGHRVYVIEAIPHRDAAVVWGKEIVKIRDDLVLLEEQYWDQDGVLVKRLIATEIRELGGRMLASRMQMSKLAKPDEWTEIETREVDFDVELGSDVFTLSNLRNPRQ